ncbi:polymer-forming cytoskeletal protein [Caulobacter sp. 17J65-9]|nr:polymer-forming cytoskeletal protein [Caulobacter sp. 17J65-9]
MFSKTSKPVRQESAPVPVPPLPDLNAQAPRKAPTPTAAKMASVLASDLVFEGNVSGAGDLHIDGTVRGDVKVGRLTVGETGNVEGGVQADIVEVRGRIVGAVVGKQVKLLGTAYVDGDISHEQLSIDVGAYFQGRCLQVRKGEPTPVSHHPQAAPSMGFSAPSYAQPVPAPAPVDAGQLIELKPASA